MVFEGFSPKTPPSWRGKSIQTHHFRHSSIVTNDEWRLTNYQTMDSTILKQFGLKEKEAKIIFRYLVKAYDELYRIVGRHTEYKIVVYHFPENNKHGWGGTSNCEIGYSYKNLDLASQEEWQKYKIPEIKFNKIKGLAGMGRGNHTFKRKEVIPSTFHLSHIWIELMN